MSQHQNSDSSEDDVCFGKYTIEEAKKDLLKYVPKKVNRRHTLICKLSESQINTKEEIPILTNPLEEKSNLSSNSNTKWSSEYLSASESMATDRLSQNSEFLEKLTKVINEPLSEASSYNTAFDRTEVDEPANNHYDNTFFERCKNQTTIGLDNAHLTLVESTVITTDKFLTEAGNYDDQNYESCSSEEIINDSIITISDENVSQLESSEYEFSTNEDLNISKSPIMSNGVIKHEEVSPTVNDSVFDSDSQISRKSQVIDHTNSLYEGSTGLHSQNQDYYSPINENVNKSSFGFKSLNISDSDEESKDYSCMIKLQDSSEYLSDIRNSSEDTTCELNQPQPESLQRFERVIVDCTHLSKISEKTEFTSCIGDSRSMKQQEETRRDSSPSLSSSETCNNSEIPESTTPEVDGISFNSGSDISKASSISGVSHLNKSSDVYEYLQYGRCSEPTTSRIQGPEIPLEQSDGSCQFDDTLEEMNRLLAQGVDYEMPEIECAKVTPSKERFSSNDIISGSFMNISSYRAGLENKTPTSETLSLKSLEKCKKFYSAEKIKKPSGECKGSTTTAKSRYQQESTSNARSLFTKRTEKLGVESGFKVPKPVKKLATPSKIPHSVLKNVISPVCVYINHSPKYCPLKRVPINTKNPHKNMLFKSVKENIPHASNQVIPKVIYKPAKNKEIKEETEVILPASIKKLIKEQVVTKHEQRIQVECNQSIERRLMESDFSIDLSHDNQDVSILTNKQPFNIRKF